MKYFWKPIIWFSWYTQILFFHKQNKEFLLYPRVPKYSYSYELYIWKFNEKFIYELFTVILSTWKII